MVTRSDEWNHDIPCSTSAAKIWRRGAIGAAVLNALLLIAGPCLPASRMLAGEPAEQPKPRKDLHGDPLPPHAIARLGTLRFRGVHGCLAFSVDGKRLAAATGARRDRVTLWDTATGREIRQFAASTNLTRLDFSADGKRLACSTGSAYCQVFDLVQGKELFAVKGLHGTFAADGKILVTGDPFSEAAKVRVWDAATGRPLRQWSTGSGVEELSVSVDGRTAALIDKSDSTLVQIRDLVTGAKPRSISLPASHQRRFLALAPDGKTLATATANDEHVCLWNVATGKEVRRWNQRSDSRPVFSREGGRLAWTGFDNEMGIARIWTVERGEAAAHAVGEPVNTFEPPCLSPDSKVVAVLTDAHALQLRQVSDGKEVWPLDAHDSWIGQVFLAADGRNVVSLGRTGLFVWETLTGRLVRRDPEAGWKDDVFRKLLPGGRLLTTDAERGLLAVRATMSGREVWSFAGRADLGSPPFALAPGRRFVAVHGREGEVRVLDAATGRCNYRLDAKEAGEGLKLSADGDVLVWHRLTPTTIEVVVRRQTAKKTLVLRDFPKDRRLRWSIDCWDFSSVSPDGRWLVLSTEDGVLHRWDLLSGKEASPLPQTQRSIHALFWSPDGRLVAARGSSSQPNVLNNAFPSSERRRLRVWDVSTGKRLVHLDLELPGAPDTVFFSHDNRMLLTPDNQRGIIHLWEVAAGQERLRLEGHLPGEIGAFALRADGRLLVSGGYDTQGLVWDLTGRMPDGQWRLTTNSSQQRRAAWEALASSDAKAAYRAIWQLSADPEGSIAFLREQVRPIARPKPGQLTRALAALDSAEFVERERAADELEKLGETIAADLRRVLSQKPSLEVRRRIEALLAKLEGVPHGRQLQALRALEVLEHIDTVDARTVLRTLADGAAGARLTEEARQALQRTAASKRP